MLSRMVGDPKDLSDLRRIEANVRFTCRFYGHEWDVDREVLTRQLLAAGRSTEWTQIARGMTCAKPRCASTAIWAKPMPFGQRPPNAKVRMGPLDRKLLAAALAVLDEAAGRSGKGKVADQPVRLALLVVHRYLRDPGLVTAYWEAASQGEDRPGVSCHLPFRHIEERLVRQGYISTTRP